jgi:hypothetical protein
MQSNDTQTYKMLIKAFLQDSPLESKSKCLIKQWNDIVYLFFENNADQEIVKLSELAYCFDYEFNGDRCMIDSKRIADYCTTVVLTDEILIDWNFIQGDDFEVRDDGIFLSFNTIKQLALNQLSGVLKDNFLFVDSLYSLYSKYRRSLMSTQRYSTHWILQERVEGFTKQMQSAEKLMNGPPRVFKMLKGTLTSLERVVAKNGSVPKYTIASNIFESKMPCADAEVRVIEAYLDSIGFQYRERQRLEGVPFKSCKKNIMTDRATHYIMIDESVGYTRNDLINDIAKVRHLLETGVDEMGVQSESKKPQPKLKLVDENMIDLKIYHATKMAADVFIDSRRMIKLTSCDDIMFLEFKTKTTRARSKSVNIASMSIKHSTIQEEQYLERHNTEPAIPTNELNVLLEEKVSAKEPDHVDEADDNSDTESVSSHTSNVSHTSNMTSSMASLMSFAFRDSANTLDSSEYSSDIHSMSLDELDEGY